MQLGYVILYVPDVAAAVSFYEAAFGLSPRFIHESGQYAEMETGATALAFAGEEFTATRGLFRPNRPDTPPAAAEVALVTEDVEGRFAAALRAGAVPVVTPTLKPWGQTISYVRDQDGFLVEICSAVQG